MEPAHFPGRDVPPYMQPVPQDQLLAGQVYFSVGFLDEAMLVPHLEPLVFLGKDLFEDTDAAGFYFQDGASYLAGVRYDSDESEESTLHLQRDGHVHVLDFERALDVLLRCSLRRSGAATG